MYKFEIKNIETEELIKEVELQTNLGVMRRIEEYFKKSFFILAPEIDKMQITELLGMVLCGIKDNEEKKKVKELVYENLGYEQFFNIVKGFISQIMYPGKTEEEIKKIQEKEQEKTIKK